MNGAADHQPRTPRSIRVGAAQLGPVSRHEPRAEVVERCILLLREGHRQGAELVVFPELALTTFFPRWYFDEGDGTDELDGFYERSFPSPDTQPLFDEARRLGCGFYLGFAELDVDPETGERHRYNTSVLVERDGTQVGRYRKVHLPGHSEHEPWRPFQHLERRYFEPGPGFEVFDAFGGRVGMALCNDRRWPETYRVLTLLGAELICIGYNTPIHYAPDPGQDALAGFHNHLVMQAGAYQNGAWVVGVAKGGVEEGVDSLAQSCIIAPSGEICARTVTTGDEVITATVDLDRCADYRTTLFDFDRYRRPECYGPITGQRGISTPASPPPPPPPPPQRARTGTTGT